MKLTDITAKSTWLENGFHCQNKGSTIQSSKFNSVHEQNFVLNTWIEIFTEVEPTLFPTFHIYFFSISCYILRTNLSFKTWRKILASISLHQALKLFLFFFFFKEVSEASVNHNCKCENLSVCYIGSNHDWQRLPVITEKYTNELTRN